MHVDGLASPLGVAEVNCAGRRADFLGSVDGLRTPLLSSMTGRALATGAEGKARNWFHAKVTNYVRCFPKE